MKLHYHPVSPYSRKALVAMLHRGDEFEHHVIDVFAGGLASDAHLAISPFAKMPVLELDNGEAIIESSSIVEYLEAQRSVLITAENALVTRHWDRLGDLYLLDSQTTIWFRPDTPEADEAEKTALIALGLLEKQLADGRHFIAGETFSLGDIATAIGVDYLQRLAVDVNAAAAAYRDRVFALDAMATAIEPALPAIEGMIAKRAAKRAAK